MRRILVTGSRDWPNADIIAYAINEQVVTHGLSRTEIVIVHGGCRTGADAIADNYAAEMMLPREMHPADWKTHGKKAGFVRNAEMVNSGVDICLAFIKNKSKGATMCRDLALKAGVETLTWEM